MELHDQQMMNTLLQLIGGLLGLLVVVVGWIGNRIHLRLDAINDTLGKIDKDLGDKVNGLDRRLVKLETVCSHQHGEM